MYYVEQLEKKVFLEPYYDMKYRKLNVLSGYASSSFLFYILTRYPDLELNLTIGMAKKDGINRWDHESYKQISSENPRIKIYYRTSLPGNHTKIYSWKKEGSVEMKTFVGSANFSWNGFRDQIELLVESNQANLDDVINMQSPDILLCTDAKVEEEISIHDVKVNPNKKDRNSNILIGTVSGREKPVAVPDLSFVDLPLFILKKGTIHQKSGLNWGQRPGREPNQAYIPVSTTFNSDNPNFFPPLEEEFTIITDDGKYFICVMAQAGRKAIHTSRNNSILGVYFRNRLGVPSGSKVEMDDLVRYGRKEVRIFKMDDETYFMDFEADKQ